MSRLPGLPRLDARAWRGLAVAFLLFGGAGLVLTLAAPVLGLNGEDAARRWLSLAQGPWALPATVAIFAVLALIGVPQFALIAAAVVVLGPERGAMYSWLGTLVSALVGFAIGRVFGLAAVSQAQGPGVQRFVAGLARNGFLASLTVRLAPFAPFVLINIAAGVTPMRVVDFAAGTAIGIIPKIALTAFAGGSVMRVLKGGGPSAVGAAVIAVVALVALAALAQRWISSRRASL